jgi:exodeoxyribonuclease V alpha subunit
MSTLLDSLRAQDAIGPMDRELARVLCKLADERDERVALAIALVSRHLGQGHVCLPLSLVTSGQLEGIEAAWPEHDAWVNALRRSPLVGGAFDHTPIVIDDQARLYLRRYFDHEQDLASRVRSLLAVPAEPVDAAWLQASLDRLFPVKAGEVDLQRKAAQVAIERRFCVISGGPGTGKTSTVLKILALLVEQALVAGRAAPRMHLMAPTGKAAARMQETLRERKASLDCSDAVRAAIPEDAATIHRVLLAVARQAGRERGAREPALLATDLVLVDEASMVDLALMAELFAAIPPHARVILLGDKHQLSSVEAGAVLGDLCGAGVEATRAAKAPVVHLLKSHRYAADSGIGELARAIRDGDVARALTVLDSSQFPDVELCDEARSPGLGGQLRAEILRGYAPCLRATDPLEALRRFDAFRVLCAHRRGERGSATLNQHIRKVFAELEMLKPLSAVTVGAPILVTENDYRLRLWNGDIGFVVENAERATVEACFPGPDQTVRRFGVTRLPAHELAFALSVHKSQGSEVDEVAVVLPHERSAVLSRELLYTAVTRAKQRVVIYGPRAVVAEAIGTSVVRSSGLAQRIYG